MPVTITYEFVQQLMEQNALLLKQNENLTASVAELTDTVDKLKQTIEELREQLNKNSRNSSKPPSSDGLGKPTVKKDRSLREASGKKQGAQEGHEGVCLSIISNPDHTENHMHSDCEGCPYHDACLEKACIKETRHEIDAVVTVDVTAHNLFSVPECPLHGGSRTGHFPADIKAAVQYGKNLQAMVVTFNTVGAVSINRTHEILSSVFNIPLATGTIKNMVTRCADSLKGTHEKIRLKMTTRGLIHCDETGTRVDGKTWWVHNASDRDYTYLTINKKRGRIGMDEMQRAKVLLEKLAEYKPLAKIEEMEEQNYNMIDNVLNNGAEKAQREANKKDQEQPAVKVSLKARLAEKKAQVAGSGQEHEVQESTKKNQREM